MEAINCKEFWERKAQGGYFEKYDKVNIDPLRTEGYFHIEEALKGRDRDTRILEIGCGGGKETNCLVAFSDNVYVVDLSKTALKITEGRFPQIRAAYEIFDSHLPFEDSFFDFIFSAYVFQHNPVSDMALLLQECDRVLRPSGVALIEFLGRREGHELEEKEHVDGVYSIGLEFKEFLNMIEGLGLNWTQVHVKKQYQYNPGYLNFWLEFKKRT